ncbi:uncharacterized protein FIESC28_00732 [Fusarium coffeatum]|uniref:Peptidase S8/S53 domain-containing protein n=1 Tax=Fusarium coffeatum TaxID=231269 RepID=A0A366SBZ4_9HYPO|nr:uncharacterized protein FIESC28_00732 [Fusarium coffeatum]RBR26438.1 hypothetical protein FIESC28_00732 [Fusarium coffeatum]
MLSVKLLLLALLPSTTLAQFTIGEVVEDNYIVTLKPKVKEEEIEQHIEWVGDIHTASLERRGEDGVDKVWNSTFKGYCGEFDKSTIKKINESSDVLAVEPVREVLLAAVQPNAEWGLASISHRTTGSKEYLYDASAGNGMFAYLIDTGIRLSHKDFQGRASNGYNAYPGVPFVDANGHGTHCAGTIAGKEYGVSKRAQLIAIKVFHDAGSTTAIVLDGYNWAVNNITNTPGRNQQSVISMSLGGGKSDAFNLAIEMAYRQNIHTVVAAGNSNVDAKDTSPASAPNATTVGAIDRNNNRASFSNFGPFVDIFAPGVGIKSTWYTSDTATETLSGTSMACPHVAGLSLYLRAKEGLRTVKSVQDRIKSLATKNVVGNAGAGSPNLLAYNGGVPKKSTIWFADRDRE